MTPEQKDTLIEMFQMGMACGLDHPFEFFMNYLRSLDHVDYKKIPKLEKEAYEAMIEFMKNSGGCPEETDFYNSLTVVTLNDYISKWYRGHTKRLKKRYEELMGS